MKRIITIPVFLLLTAISCAAQTAPDAPELTRLLNDFLAGAGRNDAAVHERFWADDLIYTRSAGVRTNKPDLMKGVRSAPVSKPGDPVTVYSAEEIKIQQYGNAAVLAFKLVGTTTKSDGTTSISNHLNTGTFIKRNGKWQVVAWQATTIPKPGPELNSGADSKSTYKPVPLSLAESKNVTVPIISSSSKNYLKGPRGGCYYLNASGNKVYVDKGLCN